MIFRKMKIYILFFVKLYYNSGVMQIKVVTICTFVNFFYLTHCQQFDANAAYRFHLVARNPHKEEKKPSVFVYLLNHDNIAEHFGFG